MSPKDSRDLVPEQQQAWFDGLPEEARKAAERAELDKNLPVLASIMQEVGVAGLCAWAAYLDVMESGSVDPFDMGEIVGAAVPTIKRSVEKESAERLKEVDRQREEERARYRREKKRRKKAEGAKRRWKRHHGQQVRRVQQLAESLAKAVDDRRSNFKRWQEDLRVLTALQNRVTKVRAEASRRLETAEAELEGPGACEADTYVAKTCRDLLAILDTQPSSNPPQQDPADGLPPELVKALRDPGVTIQADHDTRLANGQTLAEHLEEWRNAPSNTASSISPPQQDREDGDDFCERCNGSFGEIGCEHCNPAAYVGLYKRERDVERAHVVELIRAVDKHRDTLDAAAAGGPQPLARDDVDNALYNTARTILRELPLVVTQQLSTQPEADPEVPGITGHEIEPVADELVADPEVPRCGEELAKTIHERVWGRDAEHPVHGDWERMADDYRQRMVKSVRLLGRLFAESLQAKAAVQRQIQDDELERRRPGAPVTTAEHRADAKRIAFEEAAQILDCQPTPELLGEEKSSDEEKAVDVLRRFMCCKAGEQFVDEKLLRPFGFTLDAGPVVRANRNLIDALEWIEAETGEQHVRDAARRAVDAAASTQPVSESPGDSGDRLVAVLHALNDSDVVLDAALKRFEQVTETEDVRRGIEHALDTAVFSARTMVEIDGAPTEWEWARHTLEEHGEEAMPAGTKDQIEKLTEVCPECEGEGGGSGIDEPTWTCDRCEGLGRVTKAANLTQPVPGNSGEGPEFTVNAPGELSPKDHQEVGELVKLAHAKMAPGSLAAGVAALRDELRELVERFAPAPPPNMPPSDRAEGVRAVRREIADRLDALLATASTQPPSPQAEAKCKRCQDRRVVYEPGTLQTHPPRVGCNVPCPDCTGGEGR